MPPIPAYEVNRIISIALVFFSEARLSILRGDDRPAIFERIRVHPSHDLFIIDNMILSLDQAYVLL
jgi:hypothetical protein